MSRCPIANDDLFDKIVSNPHRVLYNILPDENVRFCGLRTRRHNGELVDKTSRLVQSSFLARMLYKDIFNFNLYTAYIISTYYCVAYCCVSTTHLFVCNHVLSALRFVKDLLKS